jgi:regulator of RNase E activity RraA
MPCDPDLLALLRRHDTPTVNNAMVALRGRSLDGHTRGLPVATAPEAPPFAGHAMTARLVSCTPSPAAAAAQRALRDAYYRYLDAGPRPAIIVMQDVGEIPHQGALWGEVNAAIHRGFGLAGAVVDGAIRDLGAIGPEFPILGAAVSIGNGHAHMTEFDVEVRAFGLTVRPGDLLHADRHGAQVIPPSLWAGLPGAIAAVLAREQVVIAATRAAGFGAEAMIRAWDAMGERH